MAAKPESDPPPSPPEPGPRSSRPPLHRLTDWIAPPLILLSLLAGYVKYHRYPLSAPETLLCALVFLLAGVGLCLLARLRPETLYPLILGLLILKFADVRLALFGKAVLGAASVSVTAVKPLLVAAFFGFMFLIFALRREIGRIACATWGVILLTTILLPSGRIPAGEIRSRSEAVHANLPPVLHLVLDEHIGLAGIPRELPGGNELQQEIVSWLLARNFTLYGRAFSQYPESQYALASLVNGEIFSLSPEYIVPTPTGYRLTRNDWLRSLAKAGYSIRIYQSGWLDFCRAESFPDYCFAYPTNSVSVLREFDLGTWTKTRLMLARPLEGSLNFFSWGGPQLSTLASPSILDRLAEDIRRRPRGTAFFVHLLWPHYAYVFDANCELRPDIRTWADVGDMNAQGREEFNSEAEREHKYSLYFQQVRCVVKRVDALLDGMQRDGSLADAVVIIHGDHGSRLATKSFWGVKPADLSERDMIDHYSTLMAIHLPGEPGRYLQEQVSIQQIFARRFLNRPLSGVTGEVFIRTGGEASLRSIPMVEMQPVDVTTPSRPGMSRP